MLASEKLTIPQPTELVRSRRCHASSTPRISIHESANLLSTLESQELPLWASTPRYLWTGMQCAMKKTTDSGIHQPANGSEGACTQPEMISFMRYAYSGREIHRQGSWKLASCKRCFSSQTWKHPIPPPAAMCSFGNSPDGNSLSSPVIRTFRGICGLNAGPSLKTELFVANIIRLQSKASAQNDHAWLALSDEHDVHS